MKTFITALILGLSGAIAVFISFSAGWPAWVMFVAWVSYYLFGRSLRKSLTIYFQMALGMTMAIIMQLSGKWLSTYVAGFGMPLAVFFCIGSLAYISKLKSISNIPAWFLGMIILFGAHPPLEPLPVLGLFIPITAGFLFAWLNDSAVQLAAKPSSHPTINPTDN